MVVVQLIINVEPKRKDSFARPCCTLLRRRAHRDAVLDITNVHKHLNLALSFQQQSRCNSPAIWLEGIENTALRSGIPGTKSPASCNAQQCIKSQ